MSIDILRASLGGRQVPRTPDSVTRGFASVTWWSTLEMRGLSPRPPLPSSPSPSPSGLCSLHIFLSSPSPPFSLSFPSLSNHRDQYNLMSKQESASLPLFLGSSFLLEGAQRVPPGYPGKASSGREKPKGWGNRRTLISDTQIGGAAQGARLLRDPPCSLGLPSLFQIVHNSLDFLESRRAFQSTTNNQRA